MHNHSKCNGIIFLKDRVNDLGLAFAGKVGLGPFWTLVQALSYEHVLMIRGLPSLARLALGPSGLWSRP
jgi:hypothetical protein